MSARDHLSKGLEAAQKQRWDESISLLQQAIKIDKNLIDAYESLGVIYGKLGRLDEAIGIMKQLAALDPDHVMAHANMSRFYQQKGMLEEAEAEQAEARRLAWKRDLKSPGAGEESLIEDEDEKMRQIAGKIERYKKVVELDPKDILGYFSLGSALHEAKRYSEAVDILSQGLLVDPKHSPTYLTLGMSYEALGEILKARFIYEQGIPVANGRGDIIPLRKMESRLRKLEKR